VLDATRAVEDAPEAAVRDALTSLLTMLAPICPFITEELWGRLGHDGSIHLATWPMADTSLLVDDEVEVVLQVNGKVRGRVTVPADADRDALEAAARAELAGHLTGEVLKVIVVPGKLVNLVVA
jgi:leucyl-tRNA synthetase